RAQMLARDLRAGKILVQLDAVLSAAGIAFVPLKGSALRALRLYESGERPQSDIDLLIEPCDLASCSAPLAALGYEFAYATRRHDVFAPSGHAASPSFGEHADNPFKIELHTRIAEPLPV